MIAFAPEVLETIRAAREVTVETARAPGDPSRGTVIWIVVDSADRVLVRSVRGARGRWYRDLVANPVGALRIGASRVRVRAELAADRERVTSCTSALQAKYPTARASVAAMVRPEVLDATLQLTPLREP